MDIGPYRLRLEHRLRFRPTAVVVAAMATLVALVAFAVPSGAASNGTATGTVTVALRSVSVGPNSFAYDQCFDLNDQGWSGSVLVINGGECGSATQLMVTVGSVPAIVDVQGTNFAPADNGTPWVLCAPGNGCNGPPNATYLPGADQAQVFLTGDGPQFSKPAQSFVVDAATCDKSVNFNCTPVPAGTAVSQNVSLIGPTSSTDLSTTFTDTITWIATP
jgi:hypothetical protein